MIRYAETTSPAGVGRRVEDGPQGASFEPTTVEGERPDVFEGVSIVAIRRGEAPVGSASSGASPGTRIASGAARQGRHGMAPAAAPRVRRDHAGQSGSAHDPRPVSNRRNVRSRASACVRSARSATSRAASTKNGSFGASAAARSSDSCTTGSSASSGSQDQFVIGTRHAVAASPRSMRSRAADHAFRW